MKQLVEKLKLKWAPLLHKQGVSESETNRFLAEVARMLRD
jgi:hypothetical protein